LNERSEQILDAAVDVFGGKGFDHASAAGIVKGTIYLYFQSKEEIFSTILSERSSLPCLGDLTRDERSLEVVLRKIAEAYFHFSQTSLPVFRLVIASAFRFPEQTRQYYQDMILKGSQVLADYFERQNQAGSIPVVEEPFLAARAFLGLLMNYTLLEELFDGKNITPISQEDWIRQILRCSGMKVGKDG
jgi:AcrR family transcriptional regulator